MKPQQVSKGDTVPQSGPTAEPKAVKHSEPKRFSFPGITSHLKEKHAIHDIRDEDIFAFESIDIKLLAKLK
ncbi:hypothetical protein H0H87_007845 [Tephrocybe sp. NHM501043]|nr:hypothetical protein H0H87_007845 [Tephrocybe sp. NHM501043]